jgi:hypothetical protein
MTCDGCGKERRDISLVGKDADGEPDAPGLCFICRKEMERGRLWASSCQAYVPFRMWEDY